MIPQMQIYHIKGRDDTSKTANELLTPKRVKYSRR